MRTARGLVQILKETKMAKYYKKNKAEMTFFIQQGELKQVVEHLTDPSPTIFETTEGTEVRFNILVETQEAFMKYHAMDHLLGKTISVGIIYENGIELKSSFTVDTYERRFGTDKGSIVTHVLKGVK